MDPTISQEMRALQKELADIELRVACREADTIDRLRMDLELAVSENAKLKVELQTAQQQRGAAPQPSSPPPANPSEGRPAHQTSSDTLKQVAESHQLSLEAKDRVIETLETSLADARTELVKSLAAKDEQIRRLRDDLACRDEMLAALQQQLQDLQANMVAIEDLVKYANDEGHTAHDASGGDAPHTSQSATLVVRHWDDGVSPRRTPCEPQPALATSFLSRPAKRSIDGASTVGTDLTTTVQALSRLWDDIERCSRTSRRSRASASPAVENRGVATAPRRAAHGDKQSVALRQAPQNGGKVATVNCTPLVRRGFQ